VKINQSASSFIDDPVERGTLRFEAITDDPMKTKTLLLTAVVGAGLAFGMSAQAKEHPGETVSMNSLPAAVQQTIREKAAGGEIVQVKREDDPNGRWNYEVVVRSQGKEWGFEVDHKGKFLKQHSEIKK
jgi:hypothetical protein